MVNVSSSKSMNSGKRILRGRNILSRKIVSPSKNILPSYYFWPFYFPLRKVIRISHLIKTWKVFYSSMFITSLIHCIPLTLPRRSLLSWNKRQTVSGNAHFYMCVRSVSIIKKLNLHSYATVLTNISRFNEQMYNAAHTHTHTHARAHARTRTDGRS